MLLVSVLILIYQGFYENIFHWRKKFNYSFVCSYLHFCECLLSVFIISVYSITFFALLSNCDTGWWINIDQYLYFYVLIWVWSRGVFRALQNKKILTVNSLVTLCQMVISCPWHLPKHYIHQKGVFPIFDIQEQYYCSCTSFKYIVHLF